jgi:hypothetical protein
MLGEPPTPLLLDNQLLHPAAALTRLPPQSAARMMQTAAAGSRSTVAADTRTTR